MSAIDTVRDALFGSPPVAGFKPSREGVLAGVTELYDRVTAILVGVQSYATVATLPAVTAADNGKTARVYADPTAANNTFWVVKAGAWAKDTDLVNILVALVAPSVTAAAASATAAELSRVNAANLVAPFGGIAQSILAILNDVNSSSEQLAITDRDGRRLLAFDGGGLLNDSVEFVNSIVSIASIDNTKAAIGRLPRITSIPRIASGYVGMSMAGQSNASGNNNPATNAPGPITTVAAFNNKRSVNVAGAGALIPLVEGGQETSLSGAAGQASDLLLRRLPQWAAIYQLDWVASNMGGGGLTYAAIKKGTTNYNDGLARISAAKARATVEGKTYNELVLFFHHGESDANNGVTRATYKGYIKELRTDWSNDVKTATGQTFNVPMFITQASCGSTLIGTVSSGNIGPVLAMLDAAEEETDIFIIAPGYIATFTTDGLHYGAHDQRMFGAIQGKMLDRYYQDGKSPSTVRPIGVPILTDKRTFELEFFVPVPPLRWDIDWVWPGNANLGFAIYNRADNTELPMAAPPEIVAGTNRVRFRMTSDLPATWRYTYAVRDYSDANTGGRGIGAGRRHGPRGNLCDSDRTTSFYNDVNGLPYIPANFCAIFDKTGA